MSFWKRHHKLIFTGIALCMAYNFYFIFLLPEVKISYLLYLDFLLAACMAVRLGTDYRVDKERQRKKRELLQQDFVICREYPESVDTEIMTHDISILESRLQEQYTMNCELQDYITKWCHEVKTPLSACLLMVEKVEETALKSCMREELERMNLQLRSALLGARVQSSLFDIRVRKTDLFPCVNNSIHNNQFFLIKKHFTLQIQINDLKNTDVYTDPSWLTYVLDQLISNAVKYAKASPVLKIYTEKKKGFVQLYIEDNGEGMKAHEISRIFEKGYTGSNHHNGQYRSTGMGLYMTSVILKKLGHAVAVESEYGKGTKFTLTFSDNREFFIPVLAEHQQDF